MKEDTNYKIFGEQYIEVSVKDDRQYRIQLVIETFDEKNETLSINQTMGVYDTLAKAEKIAEELRWYYDKAILKFELM